MRTTVSTTFQNGQISCCLGFVCYALKRQHLIWRNIPANGFSSLTAFQFSLSKWFNILIFNDNIITRVFSAGLSLAHYWSTSRSLRTWTHSPQRSNAPRVRSYHRRSRQNFRLLSFSKSFRPLAFDETFGLPLESLTWHSMVGEWNHGDLQLDLPIYRYLLTSLPNLLRASKTKSGVEF